MIPALSYFKFRVLETSLSLTNLALAINKWQVWHFFWTRRFSSLWGHISFLFLVFWVYFLDPSRDIHTFLSTFYKENEKLMNQEGISGITQEGLGIQEHIASWVYQEIVGAQASSSQAQTIAAAAARASVGSKQSHSWVWLNKLVILQEDGWVRGVWTRHVLKS